jgi:hypothetical protein
MIGKSQSNPKDWAFILNKYRVIPRFLTFAYGIMNFRVMNWFMELPDPTMAQATFVSTVIGAASVWFGFYVNSGNSNGNKPTE